MGLYGFKPQFWRYVLEGSKCHTIRYRRVHPDKPGSTMHLYGNPRQPDSFLLLAAKCVAVKPIALDRSRIEIEGTKLSRDERDALAWRDGFRPEGSTAEKPGRAFDLMAEFWRDSALPLEGSINYWEYPPLWFGVAAELIRMVPGLKEDYAEVPPVRPQAGDNALLDLMRAWNWGRQ